MKYAVVANLRKQVVDFIDNPESVVNDKNLIIDLANHPQKDNIRIDWFYDEVTNTFSKDGEIEYPEIEPTQVDEIAESQRILQENQNTLQENQNVLQEKQTSIEETQFIIMEAMADQYEQQQEQNLINMEVLATIYESIEEGNV